MYPNRPKYEFFFLTNNQKNSTKKKLVLERNKKDMGDAYVLAKK